MVFMLFEFQYRHRTLIFRYYIEYDKLDMGHVVDGASIANWASIQMFGLLI